MRHSSDNLRQSVAEGAIKPAHSSDTNCGLDDIIESPLRVAQLKVSGITLLIDVKKSPSTVFTY